MSRKRMISPEFYTDEKILELPIPARLMFIGIWNHSDDEGIFKNSPKQLKVQIYPADEEITLNTIIEYLELMVSLGLLTKGTNVDDSPLFKITKWTDHQKINRPTLSKYIFTPLPINEGSVSNHGSISEDSLPIEDKLIEVNIKEVNRSNSANKTHEKQKHEFSFADIWKLYPLKKNKEQSNKSYDRITKKDYKEFHQGLMKHIKYWEKYEVDLQFIPQLSTFINQKRYNDELTPPSNDNKQFKSELDKEITVRNNNVAKQSKRMRAFFHKANENATDEVPNLLADYKKGKSDAKAIGEIIGQMDTIPKPNTSADGK